MADIGKQRAAIKFYFLLGCNTTNAVNMLSATYKEHALKRTQVFEWYSRLNIVICRLKIIDGRAFTSKTDENVEKIRALIYEDRRCTIDDIS